MGKKIIKNESGMAMVAVMMALLVLSILGTAAVTMASSNVKVGLEERELQAAYYIAEAGATYYMEDLRNAIMVVHGSTNNADDFFDALVGKEEQPGDRLGKIEEYKEELFELEYGSQPKAVVKLTQLKEGNPRTYILESTGQVDGINRTVVKKFGIHWKKKSSGSLATDYAILTYGKLNADGGQIEGPIASKGDMTIGASLEGSAYAEGNIEITNKTISGDGNLVYSKRDIKIEKATVNVPIYSKGKFTLDGNGAKVNYNNKYAVFSAGDILIKGEEINGPVLTKKNFTINGGRVNGDVSAGGDIKIEKDQGTINGEQLKSVTNFPDFPAFPELPDLPEEPTVDDIPEFPDFPEEEHCVGKDSIIHDADNTREILTLTDPITYIPQIRVTGGTGCELVIKYHDGDILLVDSIETGEGIVFLEPDGEGLLNLYVRGYFGLGGGSSFNYTTSNDYDDIKETAEKLAIYIDDTASFPDNTLTLGGHCNLYGSVFAKDANLDFGGSYRVVGNVYTLGASVKLSGDTDANAHLIYAPKAHVEIVGSGKAYGPIIASSFKMDGDGLVQYDPTQELPDDPFSGEPITDPNDLLQDKGPIREK